jgi:hypothetical protein
VNTPRLLAFAGVMEPPEHPGADAAAIDLAGEASIAAV